MQISKIHFLPYRTYLVASLSMIAILAESSRGQPLLLKTETFDVDPGWDGRNNRAIRSWAQADRPEFWVRRFEQQCRRAGRRDWRVHHAGGRAGILRQSHFAQVVQRYAVRVRHSECSSRRRPHTDWFLQCQHRQRVAHAQHDRDAHLRPWHLFLRLSRIWHGIVASRRRLAWRRGSDSDRRGRLSFSLNYDPNGAGGQGTVTATMGSIQPS